MMARFMVSFRLSFDDAEEGEVSVALVVVEPVAHNEDIWNFKALEVQGHLRAAA